MPTLHRRKERLMNKTKPIVLSLLALCLAACGGEAQSNPNASSESRSSVPSNPSASSESESSESSQSSEIKATYQVSFFDPESLEALYTVSVEEGELVERPEDPFKKDFDFAGWYADSALTEEFDFLAPINVNTSVYAKFVPTDYFADYELEYIPNYSPLSIVGQYFEGDEDVELVLKAEGVDFAGVISEKEIMLTGALSDLTLNSVSVEDKLLHIKTEGVLPSGTGRVTLSKQSTMSESFLTASVDIAKRYIGVDEYGYRIASEENAIYFSVDMGGMKIDNPNDLSPEDYLSSIQGSFAEYFALEGGDNYVFTLTSVHDSFTGFDAKLVCPAEINEDMARQIGQIDFVAKAKALDLGVDQSFRIDLLKPGTKSSVSLAYSGPTSYEGEFNVTLFGAKVSADLLNNPGALLSEPVNGEAIISFDGCETKLTSVSAKSDQLITGKFEVTVDAVEPRLAQICLQPLSLGEGSTFAFAEGNFASSSTPDMELVPVQMGYGEDRAGTISQTATSTYKGARSVIEHYAFDGQENDEITDLISMATNVGKIGYALYSGDTQSARYSLGNLLGDNSMRDPSAVMMETLQTILDELKNIESRIDGISEQLTLIEEELRNIGQETLLSNFLDSYSLWRSFVTDYYTPMRNAINDYATYYFRYFYDLVVGSAGDTSPVIDIYYDTDGNVAFPDEHLAFAVDGKMLDLDATKHFTLPKLHCALAGLRANGGHVYSDVESDIVADLMSRGDMDEDLLVDLLKTIRFRAMKNYFSSLDKITGFTNTFTNFCNAFTGTEFDTPLHVAFTPLDSFVTVQETIYNFGFEIEPDFNIIRGKIASTFFAAKSIVNYAVIINNGDISSSKYETLSQAFQAEIQSPRFHHENDESGNIFCYAVNSYIHYRLDQIGIAGHENSYSGVYRAPYGQQITADDSNRIGNNEFTSLTESDLKLMSLKVKLYNRVKKTAYTFKEYLVKIGMVPNDPEVIKNLFGIAYEINGVVGNDDAAGLSYYQSMLHAQSFSINGPNGDVRENVCDIPDILSRGFSAAGLQGKLFSLDDDAIYTGLLGFTADFDRSPYYYLPYMNMAYFTGMLTYGTNPNSGSIGEPVVCCAYFVNFEPLNA